VGHGRAEAVPTSAMLFIHGLHGDRYATWGRLPQLLYPEFEADFVFYSYRSGIQRLGGSAPDLPKRARYLADAIRDSPYDRIILIGHSLGGLLAKAVVRDLIASRNRSLSDRPTVRALRGLFLLATPQAGTSRVPRAFASLNADLRALRAFSDVATETAQFFTDNVNTLFPSPTDYEEGIVNLPTFAVLATEDAWVPELSAGLGLPRTQTKLVTATHGRSVKPFDESSDIVPWLLQRLSACLSDAAPTSFHTTVSKKERLRLPVIRFGNSPYRGLQAFETSHEPFYFGRDRAVGDLRTAMERHRTVAVVGASGTGKSSLLRAGMQRALAGSGDLGLTRRRKHYLTPDGDAVSALLRSLGADPALGASDAPAEDVARSVAKDLDGEHLVIVDQLERLFLDPRAAQIRDRFLTMISVLESENTHFVLGLRADHYHDALRHSSLGTVLRDAQVVVLPMNQDELRAAVRGPAEQLGVACEPALIDAILDDVARSQRKGALPFVEFALLKVWESDARTGRLTVASYRSLGSADRPGLEGILSRHAEEVYLLMPSSLQASTKTVFLRCMSLADTREAAFDADTTRRVLWEDLTAGEAEASDALIAARLLTAGFDHSIGARTVEVAHEALVRGWARLARWVNDDGERAFSRWYLTIEPFLEMWRRYDRVPELRLPSTLLPEAERWLNDRRGDLGVDAQAFLEVSLGQGIGGHGVADVAGEAGSITSGPSRPPAVTPPRTPMAGPTGPSSRSDVPSNPKPVNRRVARSRGARYFRVPWSRPRLSGSWRDLHDDPFMLMRATGWRAADIAAIRHLQSGIGRVTRARLSDPVPFPGDAHPWLLDTIEGFNLMQREVRQERDAVAASASRHASARAEEHLSASVQREIVPRVLDTMPGWRVYGYHRSAANPAALHSDFFDMLRDNTEALAFVVGDVAGVGPEALAEAVGLRFAWRTLASEGLEPAEVLARLNRQSGTPSKRAAGLRASLAHGVITPTGAVELALAGHPEPIVVSRGEPRVLEVRETGPLLGILDGVTFPVARESLHPGDILIIYTDGLAEARAVDGDAFGVGRILKCLEAEGKSALETKVVRLVEAAARHARGRPSDDIAVLGLEWIASPEGGAADASTQRGLGATE